MAERPVAPTAPRLVLETETGSTVLSPGHAYHVGRDPLSDIVIDDARVSWHHAVLRPEDDHWTIEDENSTNGTYADGRRVHEWGIGPGSVIRFGNPADGPCAVLATLPPPAPERPSAVSMPARTGTFRQPTTVRPLPTRTVRIGRADALLPVQPVERRGDRGHVLCANGWSACVGYETSKALAKSPDDRYDSCLTFVAALRSAATGGDPATGHPPTEVDLRVVETGEEQPRQPPGWASPVSRQVVIRWPVGRFPPRPAAVPAWPAVRPGSR
jgi:hypothetical protein